jgi:hypothetical protein
MAIHGSLKDFVALKVLSMNIQLLCDFTKGYGEVRREDAMVVDSLPNKLEYFCLRGYKKGVVEERDAQVDVLVELLQDRLIESERGEGSS